MSPLPLSINDSVEVEILQDNQRTNCSSSVFDLVGEKVQLLWPTSGGVRFPIRKSQELSLVYFRDDATYAIRGIVDDTQNEPVPTVLFRPVGDVKRIQRRDYCRVRASIPVMMIEALSRNSASVSGGPRGISIATRTVDISGSGMRIHVEFPVPPGTVFHVKLGLEQDKPPMDLTARAVYSGSLPSANRRPLYRIGMEFTALTESKRRLIVRQVFKIQQQSLSGTPDAAKPKPANDPQAQKPAEAPPSGTQ